MAEDKFREFAQVVSKIVGSPSAFFAASAVIVAWAATGPLFHFSDTWQLVINTGTTIITFLMVFLIQTTQNRDAHAIHLKLDELIRVTEKARNRLVALEGLSDAELADLEVEFQRVRGRLSETTIVPEPLPPSVPRSASPNTAVAAEQLEPGSLPGTTPS